MKFETPTASFNRPKRQRMTRYERQVAEYESELRTRSLRAPLAVALTELLVSAWTVELDTQLRDRLEHMIVSLSACGRTCGDVHPDEASEIRRLLDLG